MVSMRASCQKGRNHSQGAPMAPTQDSRDCCQQLHFSQTSRYPTTSQNMRNLNTLPSPCLLATYRQPSCKWGRTKCWVGTDVSTALACLPEARKAPGPGQTLTTCSLIWMHRDFFFTAAMPVVKVFRMLVARRRASCEPPSRPAMDPESTMVLPARPRNRLLMIFLATVGQQGRNRSHVHGTGEAVLGHQMTLRWQWPEAWVIWAGATCPHPIEKLERDFQTVRKENPG